MQIPFFNCSRNIKVLKKLKRNFKKHSVGKSTHKAASKKRSLSQFVDTA